jgi:hypothetical protein
VRDLAQAAGRHAPSATTPPFTARTRTTPLNRRRDDVLVTLIIAVLIVPWLVGAGAVIYLIGKLL